MVRRDPQLAPHRPPLQRQNRGHQQPAPSPATQRPRLHQPTQLRSPRHPRDIMTQPVPATLNPTNTRRAGLVDGRGTTGMGSRGGPKRVRARRPRSEHIRRARRFCGRFGRVAFGCQPAGQVIARREAGVGVPHDRGSRVGVAVETVQRRAFAGLGVRTAGSCSCPGQRPVTAAGAGLRIARL